MSHWKPLYEGALCPNSRGSYMTETGDIVFTPSFVLDVPTYMKQSEVHAKTVGKYAASRMERRKLVQPSNEPQGPSQRTNKRSSSLEHVLTPTDKTIRCHSSSPRKSLKKRRHVPAQRFVCERCGIKLSSLQGLKRHSISKHHVCINCEDSAHCSHWYVFDKPQSRSVATHDPCGICHGNVGTEDQAVQCELRCFLWFHRSCLNMTEQEYAQLAVLDDVQWYCDQCRVQDGAQGAHNSDEEQISDEFEEIDVENDQNTSRDINFDETENNAAPPADPSTECTRYQNMIPGIRVEKVTESQYSFSLGQHVKEGFVTLEQSKVGSESDDCVVLSPPHSQSEDSKPPHPESDAAKLSLSSLYELPKTGTKPSTPSSYDVTRAIICYIGGPYKLPNDIWNNPLRKVLSVYYHYASPFQQKVFQDHMVHTYAKFELNKTDNYFPSQDTLLTMYQCDIHINLIYELVKSWQCPFWRSTYFPVGTQRLIDFVSCSSVTSLGFYLASLADRPKNLPLYQTVQLDIDKIVNFIRFELPLNIPFKKPQIKSVESLQPEQKVEDPGPSLSVPKPPSELTPTSSTKLLHPVKTSPESSPKPSTSVLPPAPPASSSTQLKCPHCDVKRSDPETLKLHAHIEHFICMKCSVQFTDDDKLQEHYMACTTTSKTKKRSSLSCYECDAVFISSKLLTKHRETAHKIEPRNLFEILQKPLRSQKFEDEHGKKSCFNITFKCSYCGEEYKEKREFCNHLKKHHNVCSECDTKFTDRFFLTRHAKVCGGGVKKKEEKRPRRRSSPVKSLFDKESKGSSERGSRLRRRSNPVQERIYKEDSEDLQEEEEKAEKISYSGNRGRGRPRGKQKILDTEESEDEEMAQKTEKNKISNSGNRGRGRPKGKQRKILDTEESEDEEMAQKTEKKKISNSGNRGRGKQTKTVDTEESEDEEIAQKTETKKNTVKRKSRKSSKPLSDTDGESDDLEMSVQLKRQTKRVVRVTNKVAEKSNEKNTEVKESEDEEMAQKIEKKISYSGNRGRGRPKGKQRKILDTEESEDEEMAQKTETKKNTVKRKSRKLSKPLSDTDGEEEGDEESDDLEMSVQLKRQTKRVVRVTNKVAEKSNDSESDDYTISVGKTLTNKKTRKVSSEDTPTTKRSHKRQSKNKSSSPEEQFTCPICSESFPSMSVVRRHSRSCGV